MEQLIIFIIIAFVSLLFNRSKRESPQQQRRPQQRQTHQSPPKPMRTEQREHPQPFPKSEGFPDNSQPRNLKEAAEILISTLQPPNQQNVETEKISQEVEQKELELKMEEEKLRQRAEMVKEKVKQIKTKQKSDEFQFTTNDIVNGIVMAEVLGPPRAVKPYKNTIHSGR